MYDPSFIYLEKINKKCPLRAKEGSYLWNIDGTKCEIGAAIERLLVYSLYVGHDDYKFYELAKINIGKRLGNAISQLVLKNTFEKDHPLEDMEDYDFKMVPTYATKKEGFYVCGDGNNWSIWITAEDELEILNLLQSDFPWSSSKNYLRKIQKTYGYDLDEETLDFITRSFLFQHGFDIKRITDKQYCSQKYNNSNFVVSNIPDEEKPKLELPPNPEKRMYTIRAIYIIWLVSFLALFLTSTCLFAFSSNCSDSRMETIVNLDIAAAIDLFIGLVLFPKLKE